MAAIDVSRYLEPLSDSPSGEDLEYDPTYLELETTARGKPEQQFGDTKVEAEEPDWRDVDRLVTELLLRTKDLRVSLHYLRAQLKLNGLPGVAAGLALIEGYLERYWDTLHPMLDPDEDNDPTTRLNTLAALCDPLGLLRDLRTVPLTRSRQMGRITYRDYLVATGAMENTDGSLPVDIRLVEGAFADTDQGFLREQSEALEASLSHLAAIDASLGNILGAGYNLDLKPLRRLLSDISKLVDGRLGEAPAAAETAPADGGGVGDEPVVGGSVRGGSPAISVPGQIRSRADVLAALDKICQYYAVNEPSHPLPLLLERAKRVVVMDFVSLLKDLAPEGMSSFRSIAGLMDD